MPTRTKQKYKAKCVYWDITRKVVISDVEAKAIRDTNKDFYNKRVVRFDSIHEFKVYLELCRIYGYPNVVRQHQIEIIPPSVCYPNGKKWRVDFAVSVNRSSAEYDWYIEAKGVFLPEFASVLTTLEQYDFDKFERVKIVFAKKIPIEHRVLNALSKTRYARNLITYKELCKHSRPL